METTKATNRMVNFPVISFDNGPIVLTPDQIEILNIIVAQLNEDYDFATLDEFIKKYYAHITDVELPHSDMQIEALTDKIVDDLYAKYLNNDVENNLSRDEFEAYLLSKLNRIEDGSTVDITTLENEYLLAISTQVLKAIYVQIHNDKNNHTELNALLDDFPFTAFIPSMDLKAEVLKDLTYKNPIVETSKLSPREIINNLEKVFDDISKTQVTFLTVGVPYRDPVYQAIEVGQHLSASEGVIRMTFNTKERPVADIDLLTFRLTEFTYLYVKIYRDFNDRLEVGYIKEDSEIFKFTYLYNSGDTLLFGYKDGKLVVECNGVENTIVSGFYFTFDELVLGVPFSLDDNILSIKTLTGYKEEGDSNV